MKILVYVLAAVVWVAASAALPTLLHPRPRRDSTPTLYNLPSNASLILGDIRTGFDCANLPYGYYADEANNCTVFHVCLPYIIFDEIVTRQFSFFCGEGTVFDQQRLVCVHPRDSLPCSQAAAARTANEYFGRRDLNFLE
ncbi:U-scoloptoxin(01)-Cw1a-like [Eriocheir sinensis]|uniref:U-scoloptoxin(01)-Cw1a-like n=1 Tax=Eriocheir sinensis TaxID=95602 RepID=UPI0021C7D2F7|nr:U-scoloptoxin(01)-Cw1a-like [Eriocheir sinensis]